MFSTSAPNGCQHTHTHTHNRTHTQHTRTVGAKEFVALEEALLFVLGPLNVCGRTGRRRWDRLIPVKPHCRGRRQIRSLLRLRLWLWLRLWLRLHLVDLEHWRRGRRRLYNMLRQLLRLLQPTDMLALTSYARGYAKEIFRIDYNEKSKKRT
jgi:hypothetical protein